MLYRMVHWTKLYFLKKLIIFMKFCLWVYAHAYKQLGSPEETTRSPGVELNKTLRTAQHRFAEAEYSFICWSSLLSSRSLYLAVICSLSKDLGNCYTQLLADVSRLKEILTTCFHFWLTYIEESKKIKRKLQCSAS